MKEKRVGSIRNVDLSGLRFPVIAVHESPEDFKGQCVARVFDMDKPTDTIIVKDTVEEINEDIRRNTHMAYMERDPNDVPSLVGVWM